MSIEILPIKIIFIEIVPITEIEVVPIIVIEIIPIIIVVEVVSIIIIVVIPVVVIIIISVIVIVIITVVVIVVISVVIIVVVPVPVIVVVPIVVIVIVSIINSIIIIIIQISLPFVIFTKDLVISAHVMLDKFFNVNFVAAINIVDAASWNIKPFLSMSPAIPETHSSLSITFLIEHCVPGMSFLEIVPKLAELKNRYCPLTGSDLFSSDF